MQSTANNGPTVVTTVRLPLADDAMLKAVCAEHGVTKSELLIAGLRKEINKLLAKKKAAQPAASV